MPDDGRTRRWDKLPRIETSRDPMHALRSCIQQIHRVPTDVESRRQLRALASEHGLWKELALLLGDEARAARSSRSRSTRSSSMFTINSIRSSR